MKYAPRKVYIKESGGYVELSYTDFCRRRQADKGYMDKLFIPVQGCLLEVVREQYADFYRDRERWRYLQKLDARNSLLSLDGFTDSEGNPLDFIADEAADIAETVVNAVMVDRLKAALPLLSDSEQELIQAIFFDGLSEREVGARLKEKMALDVDVAKLKLLKANHMNSQYRLEDDIARNFPQQIAKLTEIIASYKADKGSTVDRISVEEFPNYTIPVISLKNQKKMVAVLEKIDAKIRTNNKINDYLSYQSSMAA